MKTSRVVEAVHDALVEQIRSNLTDDLLKPEFRGSEFPTGHCYVSSEAIYHLLGGRKAGLTPYHLRMPDGVVHWWLQDQEGNIIDATHDQFTHPVPYERGRPGGFLTAGPSNRAQELMRRVGDRTTRVATTIQVVQPQGSFQLHGGGYPFFYFPQEDIFVVMPHPAYHTDLIRELRVQESPLVALMGEYLEKEYEPEPYWVAGRIGVGDEDLEEGEIEVYAPTDISYDERLEWESTLQPIVDQALGNEIPHTTVEQFDELYAPREEDNPYGEFYEVLKMSGYEQQREAVYSEGSEWRAFIWYEGRLEVHDKPHPRIIRDEFGLSWQEAKELPLTPGIVRADPDGQGEVTFFSWSFQQPPDIQLQEQALDALQDYFGRRLDVVSYDKIWEGHDSEGPVEVWEASSRARIARYQLLDTRPRRYSKLSKIVVPTSATKRSYYEAVIEFRGKTYTGLTHADLLGRIVQETGVSVDDIYDEANFGVLEGGAITWHIKRAGTQPVELMVSDDRQQHFNWYLNNSRGGRAAFVYQDGTLYCGDLHRDIIREMRREGFDPMTNSVFGWIDSRPALVPDDPRRFEGYELVTDYGEQDESLFDEVHAFFEQYPPRAVMNYLRHGGRLGKPDDNNYGPVIQLMDGSLIYGMPEQFHSELIAEHNLSRNDVARFGVRYPRDVAGSDDNNIVWYGSESFIGKKAYFDWEYSFMWLPDYGFVIGGKQENHERIFRRMGLHPRQFTEQGWHAGIILVDHDRSSVEIRPLHSDYIYELEYKTQEDTGLTDAGETWDEMVADATAHAKSEYPTYSIWLNDERIAKTAGTTKIVIVNVTGDPHYEDQMVGWGNVPFIYDEKADTVYIANEEVFHPRLVSTLPEDVRWRFRRHQPSEGIIPGWIDATTGEPRLQDWKFDEEDYESDISPELKQHIIQLIQRLSKFGQSGDLPKVMRVKTPRTKLRGVYGMPFTYFPRTDTIMLGDSHTFHTRMWQKLPLEYFGMVKNERPSLINGHIVPPPKDNLSGGVQFYLDVGQNVEPAVAQRISDALMPYVEALEFDPEEEEYVEPEKHDPGQLSLIGKYKGLKSDNIGIRWHEMPAPGSFWSWNGFPTKVIRIDPRNELVYISGVSQDIEIDLDEWNEYIQAGVLKRMTAKLAVIVDRLDFEPKGFGGQDWIRHGPLLYDPKIQTLYIGPPGASHAEVLNQIPGFYELMAETGGWGYSKSPLLKDFAMGEIYKDGRIVWLWGAPEDQDEIEEVENAALESLGYIENPETIKERYKLNRAASIHQVQMSGDNPEGHIGLPFLYWVSTDNLYVGDHPGQHAEVWANASLLPEEVNDEPDFRAGILAGLWYPATAKFPSKIEWYDFYQDQGFDPGHKERVMQLLSGLPSHSASRTNEPLIVEVDTARHNFGHTAASVEEEEPTEVNPRMDEIVDVHTDYMAYIWYRGKVYVDPDLHSNIVRREPELRAALKERAGRPGTDAAEEAVYDAESGVLHAGRVLPDGEVVDWMNIPVPHEIDRQIVEAVHEQFPEYFEVIIDKTAMSAQVRVIDVPEVHSNGWSFVYNSNTDTLYIGGAMSDHKDLIEYADSEDADAIRSAYGRNRIHNAVIGYIPPLGGEAVIYADDDAMIDQLEPILDQFYQDHKRSKTVQEAVLNHITVTKTASKVVFVGSDEQLEWADTTWMTHPLDIQRSVSRPWVYSSVNDTFYVGPVAAGHSLLLQEAPNSTAFGIIVGDRVEVFEPWHGDRDEPADDQQLKVWLQEWVDANPSLHHMTHTPSPQATYETTHETLPPPSASVAQVFHAPTDLTDFALSASELVHHVPDPLTSIGQDPHQTSPSRVPPVDKVRHISPSVGISRVEVGTESADMQEVPLTDNAYRVVPQIMYDFDDEEKMRTSGIWLLDKDNTIWLGAEGFHSDLLVETGRKWSDMLAGGYYEQYDVVTWTGTHEHAVAEAIRVWMNQQITSVYEPPNLGQLGQLQGEKLSQTEVIDGVTVHGKFIVNKEGPMDSFETSQSAIYQSKNLYIGEPQETHPQIIQKWEINRRQAMLPLWVNYGREMISFYSFEEASNESLIEEIMPILRKLLPEYPAYTDEPWLPPSEQWRVANEPQNRNISIVGTPATDSAFIYQNGVLYWGDEGGTHPTMIEDHDLNTTAPMLLGWHMTSVRPGGNIERPEIVINSWEMERHQNLSLLSEVMPTLQSLFPDIPIIDWGTGTRYGAKEIQVGMEWWYGPDDEDKWGGYGMDIDPYIERHLQSKQAKTAAIIDLGGGIEQIDRGFGFAWMSDGENIYLGVSHPHIIRQRFGDTPVEFYRTQRENPEAYVFGWGVSEDRERYKLDVASGNFWWANEQSVGHGEKSIRELQQWLFQRKQSASIPRVSWVGDPSSSAIWVWYKPRNEIVFADSMKYYHLGIIRQVLGLEIPILPGSLRKIIDRDFWLGELDVVGDTPEIAGRYGERDIPREVEQMISQSYMQSRIAAVIPEVIQLTEADMVGMGKNYEEGRAFFYLPSLNLVYLAPPGWLHRALMSYLEYRTDIPEGTEVKAGAIDVWTFTEDGIWFNSEDETSQALWGAPWSDEEKVAVRQILEPLITPYEEYLGLSVEYVDKRTTHQKEAVVHWIPLSNDTHGEGVPWIWVNGDIFIGTSEGWHAEMWPAFQEFLSIQALDENEYEMGRVGAENYPEDMKVVLYGVYDPGKYWPMEAARMTPRGQRIAEQVWQAWQSRTKTAGLRPIQPGDAFYNWQGKHYYYDPTIADVEGVTAWDGDMMIGSLLWSEREDSIYLIATYVVPEYREQGVLRQMLVVPTSASPNKPLTGKFREEGSMLRPIVDRYNEALGLPYEHEVFQGKVATNIVNVKVEQNDPLHDAWVYDLKTDTLYYAPGGHHYNMWRELPLSVNRKEPNRFAVGDIAYRHSWGAGHDPDVEDYAHFDPNLLDIKLDVPHIIDILQSLWWQHHEQEALERGVRPRETAH